MRITDITTFVVGNPWKNWVFVKLATDAGLIGLGEATGGLSTKPGEAEVHELARFLNRRRSAIAVVVSAINCYGSS